MNHQLIASVEFNDKVWLLCKHILRLISNQQMRVLNLKLANMKFYVNHIDNSVSDMYMYM